MRKTDSTLTISTELQGEAYGDGAARPDTLDLRRRPRRAQGSGRSGAVGRASDAVPDDPGRRRGVGERDGRLPAHLQGSLRHSRSLDRRVVEYLNDYGYETNGSQAIALFRDLDVERRKLLARHMAEIAKADSKLAESEVKLLRRTLDLLDISPVDLVKPEG
nr:TerB family tellurite resistance protein [Mesorhizobium sp.]